MDTKQQKSVGVSIEIDKLKRKISGLNLRQKNDKWYKIIIHERHWEKLKVKK